MLNYDITTAAKLGNLRNRMMTTTGVDADRSKHWEVGNSTFILVGKHAFPEYSLICPFDLTYLTVYPVPFRAPIVSELEDFVVVDRIDV